MPSKRIGRYEILGKVDLGANGDLLRANDPMSGRMVAIKPIHAASFAGDQGAALRERFYRDARAATTLADPCIIPILDVGEENGEPFLVMELVEGRTLDTVVNQSEPWTLDSTCEICQQIADALGYAHRMGVVHNALRPANILITSRETCGVERPRIMNYGLASIAGAEMISPAQVLAAQAFMSPEQSTGAQIDGRTDLYSLGVILYWMITGKLPFTARALNTVSINASHTEPVAPSKLNPAVPPQLDSVILKCLAQNPTDRYSTGEELFTNLALVRMGALSPSADDNDSALKHALHAENAGISESLRTFAGSVPAYMSTDAAPVVSAVLPALSDTQELSPSQAFEKSLPSFLEILAAPATNTVPPRPQQARPVPVVEPARIAPSRIAVPAITLNQSSSVAVPLPHFLTVDQSPVHSNRTRGVVVFSSIVLLLGSLGGASILFPKNTTEASQQQLTTPPDTSPVDSTPAPADAVQTAAQQSFDNSLTLDTSAPKATVSQPAQIAAINENANPTKAQSEMMNNQLSAPKRITSDMKNMIAENAPPPSNFAIAAPEAFASSGATGSAFKGPTQPVVKAALPTPPLAISAGVATGMLIQKAAPLYPLIAKQARVSGTVSLAASISPAGMIKDVRVVNGPPMLRKAAVDAVRTWRYKPYMLNNQPVEVETTINVVFTIGD